MNGENLLHCAVKNNDLESVLFLLGLQVYIICIYIYIYNYLI